MFFFPFSFGSSFGLEASLYQLGLLIDWMNAWLPPSFVHRDALVLHNLHHIYIYIYHIHNIYHIGHIYIILNKLQTSFVHPLKSNCQTFDLVYPSMLVPCLLNSVLSFPACIWSVRLRF